MSPQLSRALVFGGTALLVALQTLGDEGSAPTARPDRAPRIYAKEPDETGAAGPNGGDVRRADHPEDKPVSLAKRDFCFGPIAGTLEAISGGSQWGNTFDDTYNRFIL
ncbi:MAG: hypothetical protein L0Z50_07095 [Verrucomicrobiales bacterium]|nr:hypothetical protein [Verrucomicrobiales bacterium]